LNFFKDSAPYAQIKKKAQKLELCAYLDLDRQEGIWNFNGGERGIRTPDTGSPYTHFPGVRLQPLGHLSSIAGHKRTMTESKASILYTVPCTFSDKMKSDIFMC
jgi:hypothetical protein